MWQERGLRVAGFCESLFPHLSITWAFFSGDVGNIYANTLVMGNILVWQLLFNPWVTMPKFTNYFCKWQSLLHHEKFRLDQHAFFQIGLCIRIAWVHIKIQFPDTYSDLLIQIIWGRDPEICLLPCTLVISCLPMQEMQQMRVWALSQEDPLRRKWQPTLILAWEIPRTEEPGRLQSMGWQRVRHDQMMEHACTGNFSVSRRLPAVENPWPFFGPLALWIFGPLAPQGPSDFTFYGFRIT